MKLVNFALDFGNGYVKASSDTNSFIIPAKLGLTDDQGTSSLGGILEQKYDVSVFKRKQDNSEYIFGQEIGRALNPKDIIPTDEHDNRYASKSFQQLVDFSLAELAAFEGEKNIDIRLVTGMPSDDIRNSEFYYTFEEYLKGHHIVTRNGVEYVINVEQIKIIEQPLGTLLNVFLNDDLKVHKTLKNGLIVIIDFGSGTTIIDIYQNMRHAGGQTLKTGMISLQKEIAEKLTEETGKKAYSKYIEKGIKDNSYIADFGQEKLKFKHLFDRLLERRLQKIISEYVSEVGEEDLVNDFIVTGGGSLVVGKELKEMKPKFRLLENPQTSTVNGYYKLALSLAKSDQG